MTTVYGLAVDDVRAFQIWVMRCPLAKVSVTVHDDVAVVPVLATRTSPWNPPAHSLPFVYVAEQPPLPVGGPDVVAGGRDVVLGGRELVVAGREVVVGGVDVSPKNCTATRAMPFIGRL